MSSKSENFVDLIFNKLKTYKKKKIYLERENLFIRKINLIYDFKIRKIS